MKRAAVLGFLVLCVGGVAWLLLFGMGERTGRRGAGSVGSQETAAGEAAAGAEAFENGKNAHAGDRDDDPNRIPGPDVTIRGKVLRADAPVVGADVALYRARPRGVLASRRNQDPLTEIARTRTEDGGRFALTIPRRSVVLVYAHQKGAAWAWMRLLLPPAGDPEEITIELGNGHELNVRVKAPDGTAVVGAALKITAGSSRTRRFEIEKETDAEGRAVFEDLPAGWASTTVEVAGYPKLTRSFQVPDVTEIVLELRPGGTIFGTVKDDQEQPVVGAKVKLSTGDAWLRLTGSGEATTNDAGEYRIEHAMPGPVRSAIVEHPVLHRRTSVSGEIILPTDLLEAGQEMRYDIVVQRGVVVRGVVVEGETPVKDAVVTLLRMNQRYNNVQDVGSATTDDAGQFEFTGVTEGSYGLEAKAPFLARRAVRSPNNQRPLTIDFYVDGEEPPDAQRIELTPTGGVRGRVVDLHSTAYARLSLYLQIDGQNQSTKVDDFGNFEMDHIPPLEQAVLKSWNPTLESPPFDVLPAEVAEVVIEAGRGGVFAGVVETRDGEPVVGAFVTAMPESNIRWQARNLLSQGAWNAVRTDAHGRFVATLQEWYRKNQPNARWAVAAVHPDRPLTIVKGLELPAAGEQTEVTVVLDEGGAVTGNAAWEDGSPAADLQVSVAPKTPKGNRNLETRASRNTRTDAEGNFEIDGLSREGAYMLTVSTAKGKADPVEVTAGMEEVRVVVRPTESIAGVVIDEDGRAVAQAQIHAILPAPKGESRRNGSVGQGGRFRINNLERGAYAIEVSPQKRGNYAAGQARFETTRIPPVNTGTDNVVIVVSSGVKLSGRVVSLDGRPVPGARVVAMSLTPPRRRGNREARPNTTTNGRGEFVLKGMPNEEVELLAAATGWQPATLRCAPGSGDVVVHLERGAELKGRIVKQDGTPLKNTWFNLQPVSAELKAKIDDWRRRSGNTNMYGSGQGLSANTDSAGKFRFASLVPGAYKLSLRSSDGVAPDQTLQTGTGNVRIQLMPALSIRGQVVGPDGGVPTVKGRNSIYVNVRSKNGVYYGGTQANLDDGTFAISNLPPGPVQLQVWVGGNLYKPVTVDAQAGDQSVVIALQAR